MKNYVVFSQVEHIVTDDLDAALAAAYAESRLTNAAVSVYFDDAVNSSIEVARVHAIN